MNTILLKMAKSWKHSKEGPQRKGNLFILIFLFIFNQIPKHIEINVSLQNFKHKIVFIHNLHFFNFTQSYFRVEYS